MTQIEQIKTAQEWYKKAKEQNNQLAIEMLENQFPELAGNEDEKIRKRLIYFVESWKKRQGLWTANDEEINSMLAWLEKQRERTQVFIPKFKVGDVVTFDGYRDKSTITEIDFDNKWYSIAEDKTRCILFSEQDNWKLVEQRPTMIKWTGDNLREVLDFTGKTPQFDKWFNSFDEYETYVHSHNNIFKMFNEDGSHYEVPVGAWIVKTPDGHNVASKSTYVQKPAEWGEDDEKMRTKCAACLGFHYHYGLMTRKEYTTTHNWLNSLKEGHATSKTQKWTEEDESMCNDTIQFIEKGWTDNGKSYLIPWLKSLKDKIK